MKTFVYSVLVTLGLACGAQAATLNESDFAGGFSSVQGNYTQVGFGFETINGTLSNNDFDFLQFTNLDAGAQTISLTFDFINPGSATNFQNAGGTLRYSETFQNFAFNGTNAGSFQVSAGPFEPASNNSTTLSFDLDNSFAGGPLFLHILPTFGVPFTYSANLTGNGGGAVAPIPVPAPGLLLLGALAFAHLRVRRTAPHLLGA